VRDNDLLREGESLVGRYTVEIARWNGERLSSTVPPIAVVLTDQRIILTPQTRKRYDPAVIPSGYIASVGPIRSERSGASITLKNGYQINLFITTNVHQQFIEHVRALTRRRYIPPIDVSGLQKLVAYFENLPQTPDSRE
jgi:hypothetical protein